MRKPLYVHSTIIVLVGLSLSHASFAFGATARELPAAVELQRNAAYMPRGTRWLVVLQFRGGASAGRESFLRMAVENRPGFRIMRQKIKQVLGINAARQIRGLWAFGSAQGRRSGVFLMESTVPAKLIAAKLRAAVKTSRDLYDGTHIFRVENHFGRGPRSRKGMLYLAVLKPGIVLGSMSEKLLEQSLSCHLGIKPHLTDKSRLFTKWKPGWMFYFSVIHVQQAIDRAQNPLNVPPQIRQMRSLHLMAASTPTAVELHGDVRMLSAKAAGRSLAQLTALKKMAYSANTGANATDRQMVLAGIIERLKLGVRQDRVQIQWRMPYSLLRHLMPPHHR